MIFIFILSYILYGRFLSKAFALDNNNPTPAVRYNDKKDFVPARPAILLGQHFSAIAAAGPIVGPILAGLLFGWVPALLWIIIGSIFIGGVHDFASIVASVRHKAKSIAELVKQYMTPTAYISFLLFIFFAIIYIVIVFTDLTASTFMDREFGGAVASSSLLYIMLAVLLGIALVKLKMPLAFGTAGGFAILLVIIWQTQYFPFRMPSLLGLPSQKVWDILLLLYCGVASIVPMWILLQPRGYLGGILLYTTVFVGFVGLFLGGGVPVQYTAFKGFFGSDGNTSLFPILFITVACGACSGFHAIVSSGTTSKQLSKETNARLIGYGGMLLEGLMALIALATLMMLSPSNPLTSKNPNEIYARGITTFLSYFGVDPTFAYTFALLAFATFVYDTLDVATRLGRYIFNELLGWEKSQLSIYWGTLGTLLIPVLYFLLAKEQAWKVIWPIFGTANQLLAALTLLTISVWLKKTSKKKHVFLITFVPMLVMLGMSVWSVWISVSRYFFSFTTQGLHFDFTGTTGTILLGLAIYLVAESVYCLFLSKKKVSYEPQASLSKNGR